MKVGTFVWRTKDTSNDAERNFSGVHEHIAAYAMQNFEFNRDGLSKKKYKNPDNDLRGDYSLDPITKAHSYIDRPNTYYPICDPKTGWWYPCSQDRVWAYASRSKPSSKRKLRSATIEDLIEDDRIVFSATAYVTYRTKGELLYAIQQGTVPKDGNERPLLKEDTPDLDFWINKPIALGRPSKKSFWLEKKATTKPLSSVIPRKSEVAEGSAFWTEKQGTATGEIQDILGYKAFDYPKPLSLINSLVRSATDDDFIVMDSFAGSGTTGHAVLSANSIDGGCRRFILVELEPQVATTITFERLKRVVQGYGQAGSSETWTEGLGSGFRFCKLGEPLFDADGNVSPAVTFPDLAAHVFFCETGSPIPSQADGSSPLIGAFQGRAIYLLHSAEAVGVASAKAGNVLTAAVLQNLPPPEPGFIGARVVYAEGCTVPEDRLSGQSVTFKQIPYQIEGL